MGEEMEIDHRKETRVRQYPQNHQGEIIVFVHAIREGLKCKEIQKYVFQNYKTVSLMESINEHKIKIVFESKERESAIKEANLLARVSRSTYRFYIPANLAEVQGVISWPKGEDIKDFLKNGKGKFNNLSMKVKVLEVTRLLKSSNEKASETLVETGTVIVTFSGQLLPHKLECDKLVVPVRAFRRREMFCINCKRYGHTQKRCNNKKIESEEFKCHQCRSNDHENGSATCPRRKIIESRRFKIEKKLRQKTFAEILKELDPTNTMPGEPPESAGVAPLVLPKKQTSEWKKKKKEQPQKPTAKIENKSQQQTPSTSKGLPPGLRKAEDKDESFTDSIMEFVKSVMNDCKVPEAIQQLIIIYSTPYVEKFFTKLTDTFMQKFLGN